MNLRIKSPIPAAIAATGTLVLVLLTACGRTPALTQTSSTALPASSGGSAPEVIVYASDLTTETLNELDFIDDTASPGGKLIGLPNNGDELDPPPENDPHVTFKVPVHSGSPYRCWVHMKVGEPKGRSTANVIWVQFSDSFNQANEETFRAGTESYLTAQGPEQPGWTWVGCDDESSSPLVYFGKDGEVTVRIQAGAEGVGFDQFVLSPANFLNAPPTDAIVVK
ncbi:MAG TPA: hypothetical protein VJ785_08230 [Anaerolineales bacterium]|nr:hypothetical protein [Anaerolineales bacterium]